MAFEEPNGKENKQNVRDTTDGLTLLLDAATTPVLTFIYSGVEYPLVDESSSPIQHEEKRRSAHISKL